MLPVRKYALPVEQVRAVWARDGQPLVCTDQVLAGLLGLDQPQYQQQQYESETSESVRLGPALPLLERDASCQLLGFTWSDDSGDVRAPWTAASDPSPGGLCYLATGGCLLQLDARNTVQLIAGSWEGTGHRDGPGASARFERPFFLTPDGEGTLFLIDGRASRIRRVALAPTPHGPTQPLPPGHTAAAVHTLHSAALQDGPFSALAIDTATGALMVATPNAVYRIPDPYVQPPPGSSGGGGAAGDGGVVHVAVQAELVAGCAGAAGAADAPSGLDARFGRITDMVMDANGSLYIADVEAGGGGGGGRYGSSGGGAVIRRLDCRRGFSVSTLPAPLGPLEPVGLSILPGGVLCAYERGGNRVRLVPLGVRPQLPTGLRAQKAAAVAAAAPPATSTPGKPSDDGGLSADWLGLLTSPWEPCDVTLVGAGGGSVRAHRLVLGTRSAWLRHRLERNPNVYEVALPEAAPAVLEVAVRHMYSGGVELPAGDQGLAAGVLALSEKLHLGRLAEAARRMLQLQQQQQQQQAHTAAGAMPPQQQQYPQQQYQQGYQPQQQQQHQYQYPSAQRPSQYESGASAPTSTPPAPSSSHGGGSFHPPHGQAAGAPASAAAAAAAAAPGGGYAPPAPGAGEAESAPPLPSAPSAPPAPQEAPRPSTPGAWGSESYPPYPYPQQQQQQQQPGANGGSAAASAPPAPAAPPSGPPQPEPQLQHQASFAAAPLGPYGAPPGPAAGPPPAAGPQQAPQQQQQQQAPGGYPGVPSPYGEAASSAGVPPAYQGYPPAPISSSYPPAPGGYPPPVTAPGGYPPPMGAPAYPPGAYPPAAYPPAPAQPGYGAPYNPYNPYVYPPR